MDNFYKGRQSLKPLRANNAVSSYDKKGLYGTLSKSPPGVRKTLFESRNKENEESMLCKDFTDREITGKSPVVIPQRFKNESNSDESEEKKIKPRRSMLGFRSKLNVPSYSKDDSTYTLPKPIHSSSPLDSDSYKMDGMSEQRLQKATSTPQLSHPFDTEDADSSSFFSKGLSDSTWSVFKSNKNSDKPKIYPDETPVGTLASTMNQQSRFQCGDNKTSRNSITWMTRQSLSYSTEYKNSYQALEKNTSKELEQQSILGARTRAQAKKEREKMVYQTINPVISEGEEMLADNNQDNTIVSEGNTTQDSSMDSYVQNEATIVGTCKKLSNVAEEGLKKLSISSKEEENDDSEDQSEEYLSTHEEDPEPPSVNSLLNIISNLKSEKGDLDSKFTAYLQQKEKYDKKWEHLMTSLDLFMDGIQKNSKSKSKVNKSRKVISVKGRQSHISPTNFVKPRESKKNYSVMKVNFNGTQTPVQTNKKLNRMRKSTCYTPNSLSVLVGDQEKEIFGKI